MASEEADSTEDSRPGLTLCIRLIRSFEYRNIKTIVLKDVPQSLLVKDLMDTIINGEFYRRLADAHHNYIIHLSPEVQQSKTLPLPFKKHNYDTLKIHSYAHGAKTSDTAINLDHEEWILCPEKTLRESQIRNETEISFFLKQDYDKYKSNPQHLW